MNAPSPDPHPLARPTGAIIWLTGLSGSGKTTIATELEKLLRQNDRNVCVLDGDELRRGVSSDLGFSPEDRAENVRRVAEMPTKTVLATEVKTLAAECLQTLMGRSSHETLLRPAGLNPATADVLLRPAGADSTSQPGVLLRAHSGEGDTTGPPAAASGSEE